MSEKIDRYTHLTNGTIGKVDKGEWVLYEDHLAAIKQSLAQPQDNGDHAECDRQCDCDAGHCAAAPDREMQEKEERLLRLELSGSKPQAPVAPEVMRIHLTDDVIDKILMKISTTPDDAEPKKFIRDLLSWVIESSLQPEPSQRDERALAMQEYAVTAFDYPNAPVGSRDWCLYWDGWKACAASKGKS